MADENERSWWRRTRLLAILVLASGGGIVLMAMLLAGGGETAAGAFPAPLLPTLAAPLAVIGLIFWAAGRQDRLDRSHGLDEDRER